MEKQKINSLGYYRGIDVSQWNGSIDWEEVKKEIDYAIIKGTTKNNVADPYFFYNLIGCRAHHIPWGVYKYVYADSVEKAKEEANKIVEMLGSLIPPCGVWLDMEDKTIRNIGKEKLKSIILAEAKILESAGVKVGIYCNFDWYKNVIDGEFLRNVGFPFWIARYKLLDKGTYDNQSKLNPCNYANMWQYSSKGRIKGIDGNVDLNVSFICPWEKSKDSNKIYFPVYDGNTVSIVEALKQLNIDSSFQYRKKIAEKNGVGAYHGSANENMYLLSQLKKGMLIVP